MLGNYFLWVYVVLSNVVLVNLLIAMMSTTYSKYQESGRSTSCSLQLVACGR